ncbi:unnamed protein product, partial [Aphanomyces euteiches]
MQNAIQHVFGVDRKDEKLVAEIQSINLKKMYALVARGANVNFIDKNGATPLFYASQHITSRFVEDLIALGADVTLAEK